MAQSARARLQRKLLAIGGRDVDFIEDPYLGAIAQKGNLFPNVKVRFARGVPNECHRNAAMFWLRGRCPEIATGYYLGPDDVWRQHSWGIMSDGAIRDTHSLGRLYFGVRLGLLEAAKFAEDHVGVREALRFMNENPERFRPVVDAARKILRRSIARRG